MSADRNDKAPGCESGGFARALVEPATLLAVDHDISFAIIATHAKQHAVGRVETFHSPLEIFERANVDRADAKDHVASFHALASGCAVLFDIRHDDADGSRKLACPLLVLWGAEGAIERHFDCLALWRERAWDVRGQALPGGHYLAEEVPDEVSRHFLAFFGSGT